MGQLQSVSRHGQVSESAGRPITSRRQGKPSMTYASATKASGIVSAPGRSVKRKKRTFKGEDELRDVKCPSPAADVQHRAESQQGRRRPVGNGRPLYEAFIDSVQDAQHQKKHAKTERERRAAEAELKRIDEEMPMIEAIAQDEYVDDLGLRYGKRQFPLLHLIADSIADMPWTRRISWVSGTLGVITTIISTLVHEIKTARPERRELWKTLYVVDRRTKCYIPAPTEGDMEIRLLLSVILIGIAVLPTCRWILNTGCDQEWPFDGKYSLLLAIAAFIPSAIWSYLVIWYLEPHDILLEHAHQPDGRNITGYLAMDWKDYSQIKHRMDVSSYHSHSDLLRRQGSVTSCVNAGSGSASLSWTVVSGTRTLTALYSSSSCTTITGQAGLGPSPLPIPAAIGGPTEAPISPIIPNPTLTSFSPGVALIITISIIVFVAVIMCICIAKRQSYNERLILDPKTQKLYKTLLKRAGKARQKQQKQTGANGQSSEDSDDLGPSGVANNIAQGLRAIQCVDSATLRWAQACGAMQACYFLARDDQPEHMLHEVDDHHVPKLDPKIKIVAQSPGYVFAAHHIENYVLPNPNPAAASSFLDKYLHSAAHGAVGSYLKIFVGSWYGEGGKNQRKIYQEVAKYTPDILTRIETRMNERLARMRSLTQSPKELRFLKRAPTVRDNLNHSPFLCIDGKYYDARAMVDAFQRTTDPDKQMLCEVLSDPRNQTERLPSYVPNILNAVFESASCFEPGTAARFKDFYARLCGYGGDFVDETNASNFAEAIWHEIRDMAKVDDHHLVNKLAEAHRRGLTEALTIARKEVPSAIVGQYYVAPFFSSSGAFRYPNVSETGTDPIGDRWPQKFEEGGARRSPLSDPRPQLLYYALSAAARRRPIGGAVTLSLRGDHFQPVPLLVHSELANPWCNAENIGFKSNVSRTLPDLHRVPGTHVYTIMEDQQNVPNQPDSKSARRSGSTSTPSKNPHQPEQLFRSVGLEGMHNIRLGWAEHVYETWKQSVGARSPIRPDVAPNLAELPGITSRNNRHVDGRDPKALPPELESLTGTGCIFEIR